MGIGPDRTPSRGLAYELTSAFEKKRKKFSVVTRR